jgi:hypothetical protein
MVAASASESSFCLGFLEPSLQDDQDVLQTQFLVTQYMMGFAMHETENYKPKIALPMAPQDMESSTNYEQLKHTEPWHKQSN